MHACMGEIFFSYFYIAIALIPRDKTIILLSASVRNKNNTEWCAIFQWVGPYPRIIKIKTQDDLESFCSHIAVHLSSSRRKTLYTTETSEARIDKNARVVLKKQKKTFEKCEEGSDVGNIWARKLRGNRERLKNSTSFRVNSSGLWVANLSDTNGEDGQMWNQFNVL